MAGLEISSHYTFSEFSFYFNFVLIICDLYVANDVGFLVGLVVALPAVEALADFGYPRKHRRLPVSFNNCKVLVSRIGNPPANFPPPPHPIFKDSLLQKMVRMMLWELRQSILMNGH